MYISGHLICTEYALECLTIPEHLMCYTILYYIIQAYLLQQTNLIISPKY